MPEPKAPDASRRSERSRRAIFDAALALVTETGYAKTTIEGIAARAGVGKQTIYRWWPSKAAVLLDAFLDLQTRAAESLGGDAGGGGVQNRSHYPRRTRNDEEEAAREAGAHARRRA
ncbi:TetR/AcrR family transcriptional regulator, partial [Streptomyces sp. NPDC058667]|uniref:TetR/AcrR family transcriptional regulator n=1 Tax=Streptomyces sp. NPDC058667 TaxID=3346588 RepID=UPI003655E0C1